MNKFIHPLANITLLSIVTSVSLALPFVEYANAQSTYFIAQPTTYFRFRTMFTGANKCLDIINDGWNNRITMADCGNFSGQLWRIESTKYPGYYRLRTMFTGANKCLDIINDGSNNKPIMATCGNFSGQLWKIEPTQYAGFSRLKTQFTGNNKCLDIINDGLNNKPVMADCGNFSGQFWNISF